MKQLTSFTDFPVLAASAEGSARRLADRLRAGGLGPRPRHQDGKGRAPAHRRRLRSQGGAAALREGEGLRARWRAVAERRARRARVPRRDPHRAGGEGRAAQPDADHRRPRALPGVVAGRDAHRLVHRRDRRVPAVGSAAGRQRRGAVLRPRAAPASTTTCSGRRTAATSATPTTPGRSICSTSTSGAIEKIGSQHLYGPDARAQSLPLLVARLASGWPTRCEPTPTSSRSTSTRWREKTSRPVTDGMSEVSEPVFDAGGKYLYFFALDRRRPGQAVVLDVERRHGGHALALSGGAGEGRRVAAQARERRGDRRRRRTTTTSDDETPDERRARPGGSGPGRWRSAARRHRRRRPATPPARRGDRGKKRRERARPTRTPAKAKPPVVVKVDFDGLDQRIVAMPIEPGPYGNLIAGKEGQIFYLRSAAPAGGPGSLRVYDLEKREEKTLLAGGVAGLLALGRPRQGPLRHGATAGRSPRSRRADRPRARESSRSISSRSRSTPPPSGRRSSTRPGASTATTSTTPACTAPTGRRCARSTRRSSRTWSRVATSTASSSGCAASSRSATIGSAGGDERLDRDDVPGGLLGADFEIANGRYRFAKVFGGLNWNPTLRAPLTAPGVDVVAGEYLLAVDGRELLASEEVYSRFEKTAGKNVEITVGPDPDGKGSRTVTVVPIDNEGALRNRDWVERNLRRVQRGDRRPRRLRLRAEHRDPRPHLLQALLLPAGRQGRHHRRRAAQRRRSGGRLLHRPPAPAVHLLLGDALRRRHRDAERRDPGTEGDADRRDRGLGRRPPALDVPQARAGHAGRAAAPGAGWSASSASRC